MTSEITHADHEQFGSSRPEPFRFAVVATGSTHLADWCETARQAEALGYTSLLMSDHVGQHLAPIPALATAGAVTRTLRLGTYVLASELYNPVTVARDACSLDILTDGRFELGLGTGWLPEDYLATGISALQPGERLTRFKEAFGIIADMLRGETVTRAGDHWKVVEAACGATPVQSPRPPLLVGGSRPGTLSFAAQHADTVSVLLLTVAGSRLRFVMPDELDRRVTLITHAAAQRSRPPRIDLVMSRCFVTPRPDTLIEPLARAFDVAPQDVRRLPGILIGSTHEIIDELMTRRIRWGASMVSVPVDAMQAMAPVVDKLSGT